jgi:hypothetical protein
MHIAQLLEPFLRGPYVEIVEAGLSEGPSCFPPKTTPAGADCGAFSWATTPALCAVSPPASPWTGFRPQARLTTNAHAPHDHVADDDEAATLTRLFENGEKSITAFFGSEKWQSSITRAGDKVQVVSAVGAAKAGGHGKSMVRAASYPAHQ